MIHTALTGQRASQFSQPAVAVNGALSSEGLKSAARYLALPDADASSKPTFAAPPNLPPSGWRALDDCTLLRFLLADKGDVGTALERMRQTNPREPIPF